MKTIMILICLLSGFVFAQFGNISGIVTEESGLPVTGAKVLLWELNSTTTTNLQGKFVFSGLPIQSYKLVFTSLGYLNDTLYVSADDIRKGEVFKIRLRATSVTTAPVMVSALKYEHKIEALPYSTDLIDVKSINAKTLQSLDEVIRTVPGVNMTLDQVSIRGSSGYSRGAGTRVMTTLDGIPFYTGDTGEIIWEMIPFYEIEKIEIVKGPSSSLYGSTAIGGVINLSSREITQSNLTAFKSFFGVYDKPSHKIWDWSGEYRSFSGLILSHSNSLGDFGYSVSFKNQINRGYRLDDYYKRTTGFVKIKYNLSEKSSVSLFSSTLDQYRGNFIYWKDSRNALVPREEDRNQRVISFRSINALLFDSQISNTFSLSCRSSYYYTDWKDQTVSGNHSVTNLFRNEIFAAAELSDAIKLLSGIELLDGEVRSNIFSNPTSTGLGIYSQFEYMGLTDLTTVAGMRYDRNQVSGTTAVDNLSPRIGFNFKQNESLYYRLSAGSAFRAPTLAEIYTSTNAGGVVIKANPALKPEKSVSVEAGLLFKPNNLMSLDVSFYRNSFDGLIEPEVDPSDGKVRLNNVAKARISGIDFIFKGNYFSNHFDYTFGYTWLETRDITRNRELKYRPEHLVNLNLRYRFNNLELYSDSRYAARVKEIDTELIDLGIVKNGDKRVPIVVSNLGINYTLLTFFSPVRLNLTVNNIFNYNYVEIIGNLAPVRNITLGAEIIY